MSKTAYVCLLILANLLCFCLNSRPAQAQAQPTRKHQILSPCDYIPLKRQAGSGGQPVLIGTINGLTAKFMADTGASFCILSLEMVKQLDLKTEQARHDDGTPFLWKGKQGIAASVSNFKVSNVSFTKVVPFRILPDQDFMLSPEAPDDTRYDGILGVNIMEHFAVLLDGPQHRFGLCLPGNLSLKQVAEIGLPQPYVVAITTRDDGRWYVEAQVANGGMTATEPMILDTGSNITQISDTAAQTLHLKIKGQLQQQDAYRIGMVGISSVDTLRLGDLTLSGTTVSVCPVTKNESPLLGMDILSGYRVLIDFPAKKMYLQPNTAAVPAITIGPTPAVPAPPAK